MTNETADVATTARQRGAPSATSTGSSEPPELRREPKHNPGDKDFMAVTNALRLLSVVLVALSMAGGFAHLYALPNKIGLPAEAYFVAQQIYAGWALLGIVIIAAIVATFALAVLVRHRRAEFLLVVTALTCIVLSLVVFFTFTFPANQATENWTTRPPDWESLRAQWEYSHAVGALLYLSALIALTSSLLVRVGRADTPVRPRDVRMG